MRHLLPLLPLLAIACDPFEEKTDDADTDTDAEALQVEQCAEEYYIPGFGGTILDEAVDAHEEVFGATENIGPRGEGPPVGPDPSHVHLGWPGTDTSRSLSFLWATDTGTLSSLVQWGEGAKSEFSGDDLPNTSEGVSFEFGAEAVGINRVHELKLCGRLEPDTTYTYRVGGPGHWSKLYEYTTPPEPGSFDTFTVAISGDSRGSYEVWGRVLEQMDQWDPDFFMFSGDMIQAGGDQEEWHAWFEAAGDLLAEKVFVPAHGNHEALNAHYFAQFSLPNNERWYTLQYGNLTVATLIDMWGDNQPEFSFIAEDQVNFLNEKLSGDEDWVFANHHEPIYSTCDNHGSRQDSRLAWAPVFAEKNVDVVFAGHNHVYERSKPVDWDVTASGDDKGVEAQAGEGTVYMVSGGAGADLYGFDNTEYFFGNVAVATRHYIIAEFGPDGAQFTVRDLEDDTVIDDFFLPLD